MADIAKKIGMPAEFVGLRHEATHEELPGLQRLVGACEEGLEWLWGVYWSRLREGEGAEEVMKEVEGAGVESVRDVLKRFRGERKVVLKKMGKQKDGSGKLTMEEERTAKTCVDLVGGSAKGMESLVQIFVQDKLLIPSKREYVILESHPTS